MNSFVFEVKFATKTREYQVVAKNVREAKEKLISSFSVDEGADLIKILHIDTL